jgi:large subunit ribosomal protein L30
MHIVMLRLINRDTLTLFNNEGSKMAETITFTLVKSGIGSTEKIRATLTGLGLTKLNKTMTRKDTPELRGMLSKVGHLVRIKEV